MSDDDDSSEDSFDVLRNVNPHTKDWAANCWVDDPLYSLQFDDLKPQELFIGTDKIPDDPWCFPVLPEDWKRTGEYMGSSKKTLKSLTFGALEGVSEQNIAALCEGGLHRNKSIKRFTVEFVCRDAPRGSDCDFLGGRGFLALSPYFERTSTLEEMSLINCEDASIENDDFAVHLAGALSKFSSLKSFESHLNPKMAHKVLASLAGHKGLEKLHLRSDVGLGKKAASALSAVLRGKPKLSSIALDLRLDDCNYMFGDPDFSAMGMLDDNSIAGLSSSICGKNAVKHLKMVGNRAVTPAGWSAFATALKSSRSVLETLCMPLNSLGNAGVILIANALAKNSVLREIDLASSAGVTPRGWMAFCGVFESECSALECMSLWDCRIGEAVHLAWANSLADNNSLKKLCMAYSGHLSHAGRSAFRRFLCNTSSIMDTFLSNHTLEEASTTPNVRTIDMRGGSAPPRNLDAMGILLKINKESNTKFDAARAKIILHHSAECLQIFKGSDTGFLPFALAWMGRRAGGPDDGPDEGRQFECGSSMLYDFVRAIPGFFESMNAGDRKRKRE